MPKFSGHLALVGVLAFGATEIIAAPVIETTDRLEINWSTLRIRFYGEAKMGMDLTGEGYQGLEKRAWRDGVTYAGDAVRNLNIAANAGASGSQDKISDDAKQAAKAFTQSIYSVSTTYYGDGTVRVLLESTLPKALGPAGIRFRQREASDPAMTQYTGLLLKLDRSMRPKAVFQVVDESGAVVHDVHDMAQEAFGRNLMARWFRNPTAAEIAEVVGSSPLQLNARVENEHLVVERSAWDQAIEGHRSLLVNGAVAIAIP